MINLHKRLIDPLRRQFVERGAQAFLPPLNAFGEFGFLVPADRHFARAGFEQNDVEREIDGRAADPRAIEGQRANAKRKAQSEAIFQRQPE